MLYNYIIPLKKGFKASKAKYPSLLAKARPSS